MYQIYVAGIECCQTSATFDQMLKANIKTTAHFLKHLLVNTGENYYLRW
jgi:hypothetical protein